MVAGLRRNPPTPSATTQLVHQLQGFGEASPNQPELDEEQEDVVGGAKVQAQGKKVQEGKEQQSGGSQAVSVEEKTTDQLAKLSLEEDGADKKATKASKAAKSLKNLLRSTEHTVVVKGADGKDVKRILTSWKMADYAYKREPCPFPTRARGLFTEKIAEEKDEQPEEYRIVARGYDKFFNIGEVSWTHVRSRSPFPHSPPMY
jgi:tRNA ligase